MERVKTRAEVEAELQAARIIRPIRDWSKDQPPEKQSQVNAIADKLETVLVRSMAKD